MPWCKTVPWVGDVTEREGVAVLVEAALEMTPEELRLNALSFVAQNDRDKGATRKRGLGGRRSGGFFPGGGGGNR